MHLLLTSSLLILSFSGAIASSLDLWSGTSGQYRIPILTKAKDGTLLAFCEDRSQSRGDSGDINLVVRRSLDGGVSWTPQATVWDADANTVSDCAVVVDQSDSTVWVIASWNDGADEESSILNGSSRDTRRMFKIASRDNGASWSSAEEITQSVKLGSWTWVAAGPGIGIQLEQGPHAGRLIIPCYHASTGDPSYHGHVLWSDDHGSSWTIGGQLKGGPTSEGQMVERSDGVLLWNRRPEGGTQLRAVSTSLDQGTTWLPGGFDSNLPDPSVQASLVRYTAPPNFRTARLLFSNPASPSERKGLTVRLSQDEGATWAFSKEYDAGPSGYSCLAGLLDGSWAVLYENGPNYPDERITFFKESLVSLTDGADSLDPLPLKTNAIVLSVAPQSATEIFQNGLQLSLRLTPPARCTLEVSTNLLTWEPLTTLEPKATEATEEITILDAVSPSSTARSYRVRVP